MTTEYQFTNNEGCEIVARLVGEPGKREVEFTQLGADYGRVPLALLLGGDWRAQAEALGRDEGEEE